MKYTVKYTLAPTSRNNPTQLGVNDLNEVLETLHGRVQMQERFGWCVVDSVTEDTPDTVLVHYEYRGYSTPHVSDHLKSVVRPAKTRTLA